MAAIHSRLSLRVPGRRVAGAFRLAGCFEEAAKRPGRAKVRMKISWPNGKSVAFDIFDGTDSAALDRIHGIYAFFAGLDFLTRTSLWALKGVGQQTCGGDTHICCIRPLSPARQDSQLSHRHTAAYAGTPTRE
jgi:hypothetical protein